MANLFPTLNNNVMPLDNIKKNTPVGYKRSMKFDDEQGDFVRDGQHRIIAASGVEAWKQWCINCLSTERNSLPSYSSDFGINLKLMRALPDKESKEVFLQKEIPEALMADDYKRTKSVSDFEFNWFAPDAVEISMTIMGIDNAEIDITAKIGG